jgi:hypothetical protein
MGIFNYVAVDAHGQEIEGVLEASSDNDANARLLSVGLSPKGVMPVLRSPTASEADSRMLRCQYQPVLPREASSVWARVDASRRDIDAAFKKACIELGIAAYVGRSNSFEFPARVLFEAWIPQDSERNLTERVWARVTIEPKPYHPYEIEYHVEIHNRGREKNWGRYGAFRQDEAVAIVSHLVFKKDKPKLPLRIGQPHDSTLLCWLLGREKNELAATKQWNVTSILLFFGLVVGILLLTVSQALGLFAIVLWLAFLIIVKLTPKAVRTAGKPEKEPRFLTHYDSWQAVVSGAGGSRSILQDRFVAILHNAPIKEMRHYVERIQYRGLEMIEEREQLVLTARRGIMYCQIYEFGNDLYVGWQSFLNRGTWIEQTVTHGVDSKSLKRVEVKTVVPGTKPLSEYDLMDLNCLTEWIHAQIVSLTKQVMAELQIDQEIDFKIVRGERGQLETREKEKEGSRDLFRRTD